MNPEYFSHQPVLAAVVAVTNGPILELGCGWGSSLWLHGICAIQNRKLVSLEGNMNWLNQFSWMTNSFHTFHHVKDWHDVPEYEENWDVVLVDHGDSPNRATSILALKDRAKYLVCHDSCFAHLYGYNDVFPMFNHRFDFAKRRPQTTVVSMLHDVRFLQAL